MSPLSLLPRRAPRSRWLVLALFAAFALPMLAQAQPSTTAPAALPSWQSSTYDTGSTAWMLTSTALVLFMVPGLALFYGGMVRAKNTLNTFLLCMVSIGVIGLQWVIYGYAIAFPTVTADTLLIGTHGDPIISYLAFDKALLFLQSFTLDATTGYGRTLLSGDTVGSVSNGLPELAFAMFQGKFAIITPALIVGSVVERVRFGPFVIFMLLWATFIYDPVAHWVWNVNGWLFQKGVLDFAGGTVVHVLGGFSALAICLVVGNRKGYGKIPMPPHSLGLTLIGAGLLWFGWFGFNAGSAVAIQKSELPVAGPVAALAFTNTQIAAAAAATFWMLAEWLYAGKPTILGFAGGMVAGLVVITPCAGHVLPWHSIIIGFCAGVGCYFACKIKNFIRADDSLDAFGVHGIGGAMGAILVGYFAIRPVTGGSAQVVIQLIGVGVSIAYSFIGTLILAFLIDKTIGLRVTEAEEDAGLDAVVHGETSYVLDDTFSSPGVEGYPDARGTGAVYAH